MVAGYSEEDYSEEDSEGGCSAADSNSPVGDFVPTPDFILQGPASVFNVKEGVTCSEYFRF